MSLGDSHVVWLAGGLWAVKPWFKWLLLVFHVLRDKQRNEIGDGRLMMVCCLANSTARQTATKKHPGPDSFQIVSR